MATDVNVRNVDDLAQFGRSIKKLGENMVSAMQQAQQKMNQACEGWNDDNTQKFQAEFDDSLRAIRNISDRFTEFADYIKRYTDAVGELRNIRL